LVLGRHEEVRVVAAVSSLRHRQCNAQQGWLGTRCRGARCHRPRGRHDDSRLGGSRRQRGSRKRARHLPCSWLAPGDVTGLVGHAGSGNGGALPRRLSDGDSGARVPAMPLRCPRRWRHGTVGIAGRGRGEGHGRRGRQKRHLLTRRGNKIHIGGAQRPITIHDCRIRRNGRGHPELRPQQGQTLPSVQPAQLRSPSSTLSSTPLEGSPEV